MVDKQDREVSSGVAVLDSGGDSQDRPAGLSWGLWPMVITGILVMLIAIAFASARSYADLADSRARAARLESELQERQQAIAGLGERIERLRDDPYTLERLARRELGMVRPDEIVVVLPPAPEDNR